MCSNTRHRENNGRQSREAYRAGCASCGHKVAKLEGAILRRGTIRLGKAAKTVAIL